MIFEQLVPVALDRVFLDKENPRHVPFRNEEQVIAYLCRDESIFELARDIAVEGLNPLEAFALVPVKVHGRSASTGYISAEGNRRVCALMLLHDPDRAPSQFRDKFRALSKKSRSFENMPAVIFKTKKAADPWLERLHGGAKPGVGRRAWDAEQKARHFGTKNRNAFALRILDYAEERGLISAEGRRGKITTAQRYLGNSQFQHAVGLAFSKDGEVVRSRPQQDTDLMLGQFMQDLHSGVANSRTDEQAVGKYAEELVQVDGVSGESVKPKSLGSRDHVRRKVSTPNNPGKIVALPYDEKLATALVELNNYKLQKLYYSLSSISLEKHTPLLTVGVWAFLETLTAAAGRSSSSSFLSF